MDRRRLFVKHNSDLVFDPKFSDIADSDLASDSAHPIDEIEPLSDDPDRTGPPPLVSCECC